MKQNDLEAYKKAIKQQYQKEKEGIYSGFLLQPSRANLRRLCVERLKNNQHQDDLTTFKVFFGFEFGEGIMNKLQAETDRFRAIENFIKGKTDTNDLESINLLAILVDYTPRPFLKFAKQGNREEKESEVIVKRQEEITQVEKPLAVIDRKKKSKKNIFYAFIAAIGLFTMAYTTKDIVFPKKECMQWQEDHYEIMTCDSQINSRFSESSIIPIDESIMELKKIKVSDTTTFFEGGKAKIWYCKVDGVPEYFDGPGFHPITGKALRPITNYMINKYVKK
ncbi:hypothetical protein [Flavobacterium sp. XGLA_31]|uniref:hypothetical protein n=1 Tax=Flavobacterium sp. XGLA_31 TaxID=3447666 RepID=UPI003F2BFFA8